METLVIGGSGFIGTSLVNLLKKEHEITVVDNLSYGNEDYRHDPQVKFENRDLYLYGIERPRDFLEPFELIINLACIHLRDSGKYPIRDIKVNTEAVLPILETLRHDTSKYLVNISTGSTYQIMLTGKANSHYAISKQATEQYIQLYVEQYGINATIVRPFQVYGAGGRGVANIFLEQALSHKPYTVHGDGKQCIRPTYVDDVSAIIKTIVDKDAWGETFDAVGNESFSVLDIADIIDKARGDRNAREFVTEPGFYRLDPDSIPELGQRTEQILGYSQPKSFHERIEQILIAEPMESIQVHTANRVENVITLTPKETWQVIQDRYEKRSDEKKPDGWLKIVYALFDAFKMFVGVQGCVLDIGCGNGKFSGKTYIGQGLNYIDERNTIIGLDPLKSYETRFPVVRAFGEDILLQDGYFDAVVIATTLDHILYPRKVLIEAKRVLKDTGYLFIWNAVFEEGGMNPWHLHTWTKKTLLAVIEEEFNVNKAVQYKYQKGSSSLFIKAAKKGG